MEERRATLSEVFVYNVSLTLKDGDLTFHGFASPIPTLAMLLARETHAPHLIHVEGATYAVNPKPPFIPPTSNDWVLDRRREARLDIGQLFDLAARGEMDRMFLSGAQIDPYGNLNVTVIGAPDRPKVKLPGGGGGCNLSGDVKQITIWTAGHRAIDRNGRRLYRFVERCDFVTSVGRRSPEGKTRKELGLLGNGPDVVITELGIFDFDEQTDRMRLKALYPDTTVEDVVKHTGFEVIIPSRIEKVPMPTWQHVQLMRRFDPLRMHEKEFSPEDRRRTFVVEG